MFNLSLQSSAVASYKNFAQSEEAVSHLESDFISFLINILKPTARPYTKDVAVSINHIKADPYTKDVAVSINHIKADPRQYTVLAKMTPYRSMTGNHTVDIMKYKCLPCTEPSASTWKACRGIRAWFPRWPPCAVCLCTQSCNSTVLVLKKWTKKNYIKRSWKK